MNLRKDEILIALRAHLDSSGKLTDDYMTLAAFAGNEEMWVEFEAEWDKILTGYSPKAKYVHMREIAHQTVGFDRKLGWTPEKAFGLANQCLVYMSHLDKERFRMFYCAVDLEAWKKLRAETYPLPSPIELCNQFCSEFILMWYLNKYPDIINLHSDTIKYFFDKGEGFKRPFEDKWIEETKRSEETGVWSVWNLVEQVSEVDMKKVPGVQAADILAWAVNREKTSAAGKNGTFLRHIMQQVIPASCVIWDEEKFRKHFKPLLYLPSCSPPF
jgi:Protein of unknown function (DUF3800)